MGTRAPMVLPLIPNEHCSPDFVSDQLTDGRRFRIMAAVDNCARECPAAIPDTSISGGRVAKKLTALIERCATPNMLWDGVHLDGDPVLVPADGHPMVLHRAGKAHADRVHRELQRTVPR